MKFHTKFNFEYTQTCSFRGNLPAKSIPVHITAIGKGGKKGAIFHSQLKLLSSVCKHVHSKAIYLLSVHQFTARQVGKGGRKEQIFTHHTKSYLAHANMFI